MSEPVCPFPRSRLQVISLQNEMAQANPYKKRPQPCRGPYQSTNGQAILVALPHRVKCGVQHIDEPGDHGGDRDQQPRQW
jgi:hypothetical protein